MMPGETAIAERSRASARRSSSVPTPPLAISGMPDRREHRAELAEGRAFERAVATDLGHDERGEADPLEPMRPA